jgi:hypothetical protein
MHLSYCPVKQYSNSQLGAEQQLQQFLMIKPKPQLAVMLDMLAAATGVSCINCTFHLPCQLGCSHVHTMSLIALQWAMVHQPACCADYLAP